MSLASWAGGGGYKGSPFTCLSLASKTLSVLKTIGVVEQAGSGLRDYTMSVVAFVTRIKQ